MQCSVNLYRLHQKQNDSIRLVENNKSKPNPSFRTVAAYEQSLSLPHIQNFRMMRSLVLLHHLRYPTHGLCGNFVQASGASRLRNYSKAYIGKVFICRNHELNKKHVFVATAITYSNNDYFSFKMTDSRNLSKSSTEGLS